jgi:hypothetical protein
MFIDLIDPTRRSSVSRRFGNGRLSLGDRVDVALIVLLRYICLEPSWFVGLQFPMEHRRHLFPVIFSVMESVIAPFVVFLERLGALSSLHPC